MIVRVLIGNFKILILDDFIFVVDIKIDVLIREVFRKDMLYMIKVVIS